MKPIHAISVALVTITTIVMIGMYEITQRKGIISHCAYNLMVVPEERLDRLAEFCGVGVEEEVINEV